LLAERPERRWQLEFRTTISEREQLNAVRMDRFGRESEESRAKFRAQFEELFRRIGALPAGSAFHLHMELAPDRWDVDTAF
jgi:hypothetical protein